LENSSKQLKDFYDIVDDEEKLSDKESDEKTGVEEKRIGNEEEGSNVNDDCSDSKEKKKRNPKRFVIIIIGYL
jgi:hypothetical protein